MGSASGPLLWRRDTAREMNPFAVYRLGLELVKVPIKLLRVFVMNVANLVAPDWTFKMLKRGSMLEGISKPFESTSDMGFVFSLDMVWNTTRKEIRDILKEAQVGSPAPNPTLVDLSNKSSTSLLSLAKAGRPLVVNFGSCT